MINSQSTLGKKGIYMSKVRTHIGVILAMVLAISPFAVYSANAATGGPKDSVITLETPVLDDSNLSDAGKNQRDADGWVARGWFGSGLTYKVSYAPVGSSINLTYHVVDKTGKALKFQKVQLRVNKSDSQASSLLEVDGVKTKGVDRPPFDQVNVFHYTDAFGNVTFKVKNIDLESMAEPQPKSYNDKPDVEDIDRLHSQMLPEVADQYSDHSTITQFHYFLPKTAIVVPATKPTITLVLPKLDSTNSVTNAAKNLKQAYVPAGGEVVVAYKVTGDDGKSAVPNKVVRLKVNGGKSTLEATTDAFGFAVFVVKNSDTKPNSAPASATAAMPSASSAFATLVPEIADTTPVSAEGVEFHYYRGISTSVAKSGKDFVVSVAIAGAAGKTASVAVTGAKTASVKLSSAMQVVPVKVKAGAKTVTVVIDGKSYTSKVVAK
jgi:hypothetical protein